MQRSEIEGEEVVTGWRGKENGVNVADVLLMSLWPITVILLISLVELFPGVFLEFKKYTQSLIKRTPKWCSPPLLCGLCYYTRLVFQLEH